MKLTPVSQQTGRCSELRGGHFQRGASISDGMAVILGHLGWPLSGGWSLLGGSAYGGSTVYTCPSIVDVVILLTYVSTYY